MINFLKNSEYEKMALSYVMLIISAVIISIVATIYTPSDAYIGLWLDSSQQMVKFLTLKSAIYLLLVVVVVLSAISAMLNIAYIRKNFSPKKDLSNKLIIEFSEDDEKDEK